MTSNYNALIYSMVISLAVLIALLVLTLNSMNLTPGSKLAALVIFSAVYCIPFYFQWKSLDHLRSYYDKKGFFVVI